MRTARGVFVVVAVMVVVVGGGAAPSSAATHPFSLTMVDGEIAFVTASAPPVLPGCPGSTVIEGSIDDVADTIEATISLSEPLEIWWAGSHLLELTGTSTVDGVWNTPSQGRFQDLEFGSVEFTVSAYVPTTCTNAGAVCEGTLSLTMAGGTMLPPTLMFIDLGGMVDSLGECGYPWSWLLSGGSLAIWADSTTTPPPPGAIFW